MTNEQIKQAADQYIGYPKETGEGIETAMRRDAFEDGARWRINSAWHDASDCPKDGRPALGATSEGTAVVMGPSHSRHYNAAQELGITRWAYIDDLLPDTVQTETTNQNQR